MVLDQDCLIYLHFHYHIPSQQRPCSHSILMVFGEWCVHFRTIRPQNCKFTLTRIAFITSSKLMHTYILFEMVTPVEEVHLARKISNRKIMYNHIYRNSFECNPIQSNHQIYSTSSMPFFLKL